MIDFAVGYQEHLIPFFSQPKSIFLVIPINENILQRKSNFFHRGSGHQEAHEREPINLNQLIALAIQINLARGIILKCFKNSIRQTIM